MWVLAVLGVRVIPRLDCLGLIEAVVLLHDQHLAVVSVKIPRLDCLGLIEARHGGITPPRNACLDSEA